MVLSTRSNGRLPLPHPSISALNYVITAVKIDDNMYFTDASAKYGDWNILPEKCMVEKARLVGQKNSQWVDLTSISKSTRLLTSLISFEDNHAIFNTKSVSRNNSAYDFREVYYQHEDEQDYIEKQGARLSGEIEGLVVKGLEQTDMDVTSEFVLKKPVDLDEEFIYFNPLVSNPFTDNPFKNEERKFPVNFNYPYTLRQIITISVPDGYAVDELPESVKYHYGENNEINFSYRIAQTGENISLQYMIQINELTILPDQYVYLRDLFAKIVLKNSEQIVFKKIEI